MSQPGLLGSLRVFALYMAGVLLGSLGASVIEPKKYLVGASAGVYALISAHLGVKKNYFTFVFEGFHFLNFFFHFFVKQQHWFWIGKKTETFTELD